MTDLIPSNDLKTALSSVTEKSREQINDIRTAVEAEVDNRIEYLETVHASVLSHLRELEAQKTTQERTLTGARLELIRNNLDMATIDGALEALGKASLIRINLTPSEKEATETYARNTLTRDTPGTCLLKVNDSAYLQIAMIFSSEGKEGASIDLYLNPSFTTFHASSGGYRLDKFNQILKSERIVPQTHEIEELRDGIRQLTDQITKVNSDLTTIRDRQMRAGEAKRKAEASFRKLVVASSPEGKTLMAQASQFLDVNGGALSMEGIRDIAGTYATIRNDNTVVE